MYRLCVSIRRRDGILALLIACAHSRQTSAQPREVQFGLGLGFGVGIGNSCLSRGESCKSSELRGAAPPISAALLPRSATPSLQRR